MNLRLGGLFLLCFLVFLGLTSAQARPGGGHSSAGHSSSTSSSTGGSTHFSTGSGSTYSSGGSGGHFDLKEFMLTLLVVLIIGISIYLILSRVNRQSAYVPRPTFENQAKQILSLHGELSALKASDVNFSCILFLDFVHSLYSKFYSYAGQPAFSQLSPFLSTELQQVFSSVVSFRMNEIVVNSINFQSFNTQAADMETICVEIDANYTRHLQGIRSRYAVSERWVFYRKKGLLSKEPAQMHCLSCPQCGAPAHFTDAGACLHCGSFIQKGESQWYAGKRVVMQTSALSAEGLVSYAEEQGTSLPSIIHPDLEQQIRDFQTLNHISDWQAYLQQFIDEIVKVSFVTIYQHWSLRNWDAVRHLISDRLFEANQFWMNLYTEQNWFNRLDKLNVEKVKLVKIEVDAFYEAVTVRVFASCFDYTEDATGKLIGGSKRELRRYSEYWTYVRRTGVEKHLRAYSIKSCPNCGAPADNMGQTAECGYCGSKISTGEFSWVLYLIQQDEFYQG